jgi:CDP-glucose 4,6-dehydratase
MISKNISRFYKNKKVLITGVTGFKGSWLASFLLILGAKVYGTASKKSKKTNLFHQLRLDKRINFKILDIRDLKKLKNYIKQIKPILIFHFAGQTIILDSYKFPEKTFDINSRGGLNILEASRTSKFVKSLIITTSDKCYESKKGSKGFKENDRLGGVDPYSASKVSVEIMLKAYQESFFKKKLIGASSVRSGNVIGGGDWASNRLIPDCIKSIKKNKTIFLRNPNFNRPWQFVLEPLKGYLILAKQQYQQPVKFSSSWNFGTKSNTVTSVKTIVRYFINFWGKGKFKVSRQKFYEQMNLQLDISKAKKYLKWLPTYNIRNSVKISVDWYKRVLINKEDPIKVTEDQIKNYIHDSKIN